MDSSTLLSSFASILDRDTINGRARALGAYLFSSIRHGDRPTLAGLSGDDAGGA
jgi:hypothetical protein